MGALMLLADIVLVVMTLGLLPGIIGKFNPW